MPTQQEKFFTEAAVEQPRSPWLRRILLGLSVGIVILGIGYGVGFLIDHAPAISSALKPSPKNYEDPEQYTLEEIEQCHEFCTNELRSLHPVFEFIECFNEDFRMTDERDRYKFEQLHDAAKTALVFLKAIKPPSFLKEELEYEIEKYNATVVESQRVLDAEISITEFRKRMKPINARPLSKTEQVVFNYHLECIGLGRKDRKLEKEDFEHIKSSMVARYWFKDSDGHSLQEMLVKFERFEITCFSTIEHNQLKLKVSFHSYKTGSPDLEGEWVVNQQARTIKPDNFDAQVIASMAKEKK